MRKVKNFLHKLGAVLANFYYGYPARKMIMIGVTGTDGKTTTTSLIYYILEKSKKKVAMVSSIGAYINKKKYDTGFHVTTPSSFFLQKYLKKAFAEGSRYLVLEVTSHALDQARVGGISFDIGVITNISNEHLDYHKNYEEYAKTKSKLFSLAKVAVLNRDDKSYEYLKSKIKNKKIITYGLTADSDVNPINFPVTTGLIGKFNQYNIMAAAAVCRELNLKDENIKKAIAAFTPPVGRQEIIHNNQFTVMIDFAHTPNALFEILPEIRKITKGRLIHVFGSAGQRDKLKRPEMGKASAKFSDIIILTAEDPRSEPVEKITDQIADGINNFEIITGKNFQISKILKNKKYLFKIPDRKEAIGLAINLAQRNDTVLLTGKGHEKSMNYGQGEVDWNEKETAEQAVKTRVKIL